MAARTDDLDYGQQHQLLVHAEAAIRSADPEERRIARSLVEQFSSRPDLYPDVREALSRLGVSAGRREPVAGTIAGLRWKSLATAGVLTAAIVAAAFLWPSSSIRVFLDAIGCCVLVASLAQGLSGVSLRRQSRGRALLLLNSVAAVLLLAVAALVVSGVHVGRHPLSELAFELALAFALRGTALVATAMLGHAVPERGIYLGLGVAHLVAALFMAAMWLEPPSRLRAPALAHVATFWFLVFAFLQVIAALTIREMSRSAPR